LWSSVAYLLCAAAPSYGWLLFCRFLQGVGASLIVSCAPALVIGLFPDDKRSRAVSVFTVIYAIGSAAGPFLGGAFIQVWGWPSVFWFRAPLALMALLFLEGVPAVSRPGLREPLDIVGAVMLTIGISTLLLTLNLLQSLDQNALLAIGLPAISAVSLFCFARWERRVAQPIVNFDFFRMKGFATVNVASFLIYLTSFSVLLFGPYYLVRFANLSVLAAGAILAASFAGSIIASPLAGSLISRVAATHLASLGALLDGAGLVLIGSWTPGATVQAVALIGALLLQGFGVGLFQVAYMDIVMRTLPRQHRGVAGSITMLSRSLGVVTGATVLTLIFHAIEGFASGDGFLSAFRATFWLAGVASALAALLVQPATKIER
jgi:MFS family permease